MPVRILIADDHDVVREGVKMMLRSRVDWEICGEASDGEEAVEKAKTLHPDAVVLDITMPQMNGLQAAEVISQLPGGSRIVMFTMHDSESVVRSAKEAGAQGVVVKAYAARDLIRAIEKVLAGGTFFGEDPNSAAASASLEAA